MVKLLLAAGAAEGIFAAGPGDGTLLCTLPQAKIKIKTKHLPPLAHALPKEPNTNLPRSPQHARLDPYQKAYRPKSTVQSVPAPLPLASLDPSLVAAVDEALAAHVKVLKDTSFTRPLTFFFIFRLFSLIRTFLFVRAPHQRMKSFSPSLSGTRLHRNRRHRCQCPRLRLPLCHPLLPPQRPTTIRIPATTIPTTISRYSRSTRMSKGWHGPTAHQRRWANCPSKHMRLLVAEDSSKLM